MVRRLVVSTESTNTCRSMRHLIIRSRRKLQLSWFSFFFFFLTAGMCTQPPLGFIARLDGNSRKEARCRRDRVRNVKRQRATSR